MYHIDEDNGKEKYTLIVPATLDFHFPFLKYMFWSKEYKVEILENTEDIVDTGLAYANNEMCFPFILMVGQVIKTLQSREGEVARTRLLVPTAGDACRGACYIGLLAKALKKAGYEECKVITLNVRHVEEEINMKISLDMAFRGMAGMFYGDILMLLSNQVRPYEQEAGSTEKALAKWKKKVTDDLKSGKNLSPKAVKNNLKLICEDFKKIQVRNVKRQKISLVGEFYAKYCALGNWDVVKYMEDRECEVHVNGISWYALYYIDTHMPDNKGIEQKAFKFVRGLISDMQDYMIECMRDAGFHSMDNLDCIKEMSKEFVSQNFKIGDGWLLGAEVIGSVVGLIILSQFLPYVIMYAYSIIYNCPIKLPMPFN